MTTPLPRYARAKRKPALRGAPPGSGFGLTSAQHLRARLDSMKSGYGGEQQTAALLDKADGLGGCVYFIVSGMKVKIGYATNLRMRLDQMQTGSPHYLYVIGILPGGRREEFDLHDRFDAYRFRGEWFALSAEISDFIAREAITE